MESVGVLSFDSLIFLSFFWPPTTPLSTTLNVCLRRYLVAVGGMALQQQRREQLDQMLGAEDTALLEQEGVLEPAIPQPSCIWGEAGAAERGAEGEVEGRERAGGSGRGKE